MLRFRDAVPSRPILTQIGARIAVRGFAWCGAAAQPAELRAQRAPDRGLDLIREQQYVKRAPGAANVEPDPEAAVARAGPELEIVEIELGQRDAAVAAQDDARRRPRPKNGRVREHREQAETPDAPGRTENHERREHDAVQREPPRPQDQGRLRLEVDGSRGRVR